ncbi:helix-turn-helix protein [Streptomyces sp. 1114.5]|uniref:Scr1 family TA system antitoxin-like transcriptional regulator n=1 Tax=Streptomyces sp. 1114.5 TaxID=1938830 RepID=UPI000EAEE828|nr:Scr1 family TA system antitoxin-like transcriptional regulator [Streptomyces sp. 1114.5]RKT17127.1 helix-turn-helix protein [Streptomyces sp. 1114.5]
MTFDPQSLGQSNSDLAAVLQELRKRAGLSGVQLARRVNMSQSKISKIETGKVTPSLVDVELILRVLRTPSELVAHVTALARIANTEWQDARALRRKGLDKKQIELASLERNSTTFRYFLPTMITGLLATPDYIRASLAPFPGDHTKAIAKKLERQAVLYDSAKRFTFILTEQACLWPLVREQAMAMQLDRLASVSLLPNVRLGVIPMAGHMPWAPLNVFTVYDAALATVEVSTGALVFRDPRDIQEYLHEFRTFEGYSLWGDEARAKLGAWANRFRSISRDL